MWRRSFLKLLSAIPCLSPIAISLSDGRLARLKEISLHIANADVKYYSESNSMLTYCYVISSSVLAQMIVQAKWVQALFRDAGV